MSDNVKYFLLFHALISTLNCILVINHNVFIVLFVSVYCFLIAVFMLFQLYLFTQVDCNHEKQITRPEGSVKVIVLQY